MAVAHNLGSETKKATGIPMFMAIGQCGSVLGSHLYPSTEGPRYMYVIFYQENNLALSNIIIPWIVSKGFAGKLH